MTPTAPLTLGDVAQLLFAVTLPPEHATRPITNTGVDSRAIKPGDFFVGLSGERTDGNLYLKAAFAAGAVGALAEDRMFETLENVLCVWPDGAMQARGGESGQAAGPAHTPVLFVVPDALRALQALGAAWRQTLPVVTIGITGSVGKSTTKETVANVLATRYVTLRSEGNYNNEIGLPLTLLRLRRQHERAVLEMGMYAIGEIKQLCEWARPRVGVVTNVGPVHLARLGAIERIAQAKSELPVALPPAEDGGVAILNRDDPLVWAMAGITQARVFSYGLHPESDLWADQIESEGLEGIRFRCHYAGNAYHIHLPLLGRHSVHTALRAVAVGLTDNLSWDEIVHGLQDVRGQLRLMVVPGLRETTLIDDTYNASPDSTLAALNLLRDISNSSHRAIAVLGDMYELGAYEQAGHRLVGGRAAQVVNKLIAVGQRARWIAEEALAVGMNTADVYPVDTNTDAIGILQGLIRPGDVVLIKGSRAAGMEVIVDALSRREGGPALGPKASGTRTPHGGAPLRGEA
ncbi:MAG: UDP-N-acetylmuramoyl-tripeptide--D-alanyl-D-alanine ligase [Nitrososphaerales archaeon]